MRPCSAEDFTALRHQALFCDLRSTVQCGSVRTRATSSLCCSSRLQPRSRDVGQRGCAGRIGSGCAGRASAVPASQHILKSFNFPAPHPIWFLNFKLFHAGLLSASNVLWLSMSKWSLDRGRRCAAVLAKHQGAWHSSHAGLGIWESAGPFPADPLVFPGAQRQCSAAEGLPHSTSKLTSPLGG